jgi:hypothetical protein
VVRAHAFPKGPKKSALSEVTLLNLNPGLELSNLKIQVTSNTGQNVSVTPQPLIFDPKDQRFSQVQVFYTLQEANLWFEQNLGWSWAGRLKVETQLGHPEKINSAFYYANRIRLGEGDGVIYENIPFDPSIVVHESTHALIDRLSSLPFQGEGGSINEAYADFITSCQQNSSALGETAYKLGPYTRNLSSSLNWHDLNGGLYNDSLVLSTFFWSLKEKIGEQTTLKLLLKVLRDTRPDENLESFKRKLIIQSKLILPPQEQKSFNQLLNERKWL